MTGFPAHRAGDFRVPREEPATPPGATQAGTVQPGAALPGAGRPGADPAPARDGDEAWAMLAYLGIPFFSFLAPLAVRLTRSAGSPYVRLHATQALNMAITLALYNVCALILAGVLAVDAVSAALEIALPLALALWLACLGYLVRAAIQASLGEFYTFPKWICATVVSP